ncbi:unnamed protein product [Colletotrichum noveboracense]|uniref:Uncharacterized protein n=1 Tax=Colletotrichum noveboracense TaxID=2664923 RepID=A0A9W4S784_9PEZI|nr:unnamed protein product [Colletotrichum noveboracense]
MTEFTKSFIAQQLKRRLHKGGETDSKPITSDETKMCEAAILAWQDSLGAFTLVALEQLAAGVAASSSRTAVIVLKTHI